MPHLKLMALDADDLTVLSAHLQDALLTVADLDYQFRNKRFLAVVKRFAWQAGGKRWLGLFGRPARYERRQSALRFERVLAVQSRNLPAANDTVLSLLAMTFVPAEPPAGAIVLTFSAGIEVRLTVECIEAELTDLGPVWATTQMPRHAAAEEGSANRDSSYDDAT
jgi:Protein of unknown function (DUF2948)